MDEVIQRLRQKATIAATRRDDAVRRYSAIQSQINQLRGEEELATLSAALLRTMIDQEVTNSVKAVEELMTEGLQAVFEDQDLSVRADIDIQHGKVSVDFITIQKRSDGSTIEGLSKDAFGGAVTTVQSVILRVLVTLRRGLRPVLFMDETLPAFDSNYVHNMGRFLQTLCDRLGYDMLLVSHNPAMVEAANVAYRIQKVNDKANFKKIRG